MSGPWEKFATPVATEEGPWSRFAQAPAQQDAPPKSREWLDVPGEALRNAPSSAAHLAENIVAPFLSPVQTAKQLGSLAAGVASKLTPGPTWWKGPGEDTADAVGQALKDRYGSGEAIKKTLATDPVGAAADVAGIFTGGGTLAARAPGVIGQFGRAAGAVGSAIDPIMNAGRAAELVGKGAGYAGSAALGRTTGVGGTVIRTAAEEGFKGGESGKVFRENMRGADPEGLVGMADSALDQMRTARNAEYNTGMTGVRADPTILDMAPVVNSYANAVDIGTFKGKTINRSAVETQTKIKDVLTEWMSAPPAEYHTPAGFDALKQTIGDIRDSTPHGTPSRVIADRVYHSVRQQIEKQAPDYAKTMKDYGEASEKLKQLQKTFARTANGADETAVNRLLSTARNNVTSNYSQRGNMMRELAKYEPNLPAAIAGQTLNSYAPRGLTANLAGTGGLAMLAAHPYLAPAATAFMPRVVGEAAHGAGRVAGLLDQFAPSAGAAAGTAQAANQFGRLDELRRRAGLLTP